MYIVCYSVLLYTYTALREKKMSKAENVVNKYVYTILYLIQQYLGPGKYNN